jgi:hypothetical protein
VLRREHVLVFGGWVVKQDREPVLEEGPVLAAIDGLRKIAQRWIRLLGLDAVVTSYVEVITVDVIEVEITRLEAELPGPIPTVVADTPGTSEPPGSTAHRPTPRGSGEYRGSVAHGGQLLTGQPRQGDRLGKPTGALRQRESQHYSRCVCPAGGGGRCQAWWSLSVGSPH